MKSVKPKMKRRRLRLFHIQQSFLVHVCSQVNPTLLFQLEFNICLLSAVLRIKAVDRGVVVIQGTEAERYLAMSDEGRLYSSVSTDDVQDLNRTLSNWTSK